MIFLLVLSITWLFKHSFVWCIIHNALLMPSTLWIISTHLLLCDSHNPPLTISNGVPNSVVCSTQHCTIIITVSFTAPRSLTLILQITYNRLLRDPSPSHPSTPLLYTISYCYNPIHSIVTTHSLPCHHTTQFYYHHREWLPFIHCCAKPRLLHTRTFHFACSHFIFPLIRHCPFTFFRHTVYTLYSTLWMTPIHSLMCRF